MNKTLVPVGVLHEHITAALGFDGFKIAEVHIGDRMKPGVMFLEGRGHLLLLAVHSTVCPRTNKGADIPPVNVHLKVEDRGDIKRAENILPKKKREKPPKKCRKKH